MPTPPAPWLRFVPPLALTTFRLFLAPTVLLLAAAGVEGWVWPAILFASLMSDLFDGIAARRLGVSRPWLRRYDSATDVAFYLAVVGAVWMLREPVVREYAWGIGVVLVLELVCNAVSLTKNWALPATHSYAAKVWAPMLALTFAVVLGWGEAWPLLDLTIGYGVLVDLEVVAIILLTPGAAVDVPTVAHAWRLRKSKGS
jgi:CDP-diacylglycerol--glycerol-3-phosphate 3-phosphatidyltransferase